MRKLIGFLSLVLCFFACDALLFAAPSSRFLHKPAGLLPEMAPFGNLSTLGGAGIEETTNTRSSLSLGSLSKLADKLEYTPLTQSDSGEVALRKLPAFKARHLDQYAALTANDNYVFFTLSPTLQPAVESLIKETSSPHVAVVVMEPRSGRILAVANKSNLVPEMVTYPHFPAASLFKLVTAAAAIEKAGVSSGTKVAFRGGTYTLNKWNYKPDARKDRRIMTIGEALGKSCNPAFARIALKYLSASSIGHYANMFGFNSAMPFDMPVSQSSAVIPSDEFGLTLAAAGFGDVTMSPLHAASMMSALANDGVLNRPSLIDRVVTPRGGVLYESKPSPIKRAVSSETAATLLGMMENTTTIGTSRSEFTLKRNKPRLPGIQVAAKTGTLSGEFPKGVNNWFVAAAPSENPQIALAVLVVNPRGVSTKASHIGRKILEYYFK